MREAAAADGTDGARNVAEAVVDGADINVNVAEAAKKTVGESA